MSKALLDFFNDQGFEEALTLIERSENHSVIRKIAFPEPSQINISKLEGYENYKIHRGIYLDTETTGLSHYDSEVIQICMLPFTYALDSESGDAIIAGVYPPYVGFQEPSKPLTKEIIDLTGITMDMLKGQSLDVQHINSLLDKSEIVIAHNAAFDRPFTHKISKRFTEKKWACSMSDIHWKKMGYESLKLIHIAMDLGFYFEPHQADKDCLAGVAILAQSDKNGESFFHKLMVNAEKETVIIRAEHAPFEAKDLMKHRGYNWEDGSDGTTKGWQTIVSIDMQEQEEQWLTDTVYKGRPNYSKKRKNALTRFF